ncbi:MAG: hypothetical protein ACI39R_05225 [Lachnospiraceae bacterium]
MDLNKVQNFMFGIFAVVGVGLLIGGITSLGTAIFNPSVSDRAAFLIMAAFLVFMGIIFALVGIIPLNKNIKTSRKKKFLLDYGRVIEAKIESVYLDTSYAVNGYNPFIITCIYTDEYTGQVMRFKSDRIWDGNVGLLTAGADIKVHIDPADNHNYYVNPDSALAAIRMNNNIIDM